MNNEIPLQPLGTKPFIISVANRINELAEAIQRYAYTDIDYDKRYIEKWATEIIEQCKFHRNVLERLDKIDKGML